MMCGRFSLLTYAEKLAERFNVQEVIDRPDPIYNIAPMHRNQGIECIQPVDGSIQTTLL